MHEYHCTVCNSTNPTAAELKRCWACHSIIHASAQCSAHVQNGCGGEEKRFCFSCRDKYAVPEMLEFDDPMIFAPMEIFYWTMGMKRDSTNQTFGISDEESKEILDVLCRVSGTGGFPRVKWRLDDPEDLQRVTKFLKAYDAEIGQSTTYRQVKESGLPCQCNEP